MKNLNWLADDTVTRLQEESKEKFNNLNTNKVFKQPEEAFVQGFLEGINYLRDAIVEQLNEKNKQL